jgi:hypothetical protein
MNRVELGKFIPYSSPFYLMRKFKMGMKQEGLGMNVAYHGTIIPHS